MKYTVQYVHVIERTETCTVEADSEEEAIQKAKDGDYEDEDAGGPEQGLETKDYKVIEE